MKVRFRGTKEQVEIDAEDFVRFSTFFANLEINDVNEIELDSNYVDPWTLKFIKDY